ncbi:MAG: L,D-transpeptidase [Chloracidobacterium sp.]|nr:L,D-transpeptidase [Chloracidobacterium sp.]
MQRTDNSTIHEPSIVIRKSARVLELFDGDRLAHSFPVVLGFSPDLDKEREGDGRTPEGEYLIVVKNPESSFHLSLGINYPGPKDAEAGFAAGLITQAEYHEILDAAENRKLPPQKTALGGEIYIHGGGCDGDWTRGCIALDNSAMTELFDAVPVGTGVRIVP